MGKGDRSQPESGEGRTRYPGLFLCLFLTVLYLPMARRTGVAVVKLAPSVGSMPGTSGYPALFDYNVGALAQALSAASN